MVYLKTYVRIYPTVKGLCLHFRTNVRLSGTAYLMFLRLNPHFEFDTEFDKTLKNQCFHPFPPHQKSPNSTQKSPQTLVKSTFLRTHLKSSKIPYKLFKKITPLQPHFIHKNQAFSAIRSSKKSPSHRTHQNSHYQSQTFHSLISH